MSMRDLIPNPKNEHARDELDAWSVANYQRLPELVRKDIEAELLSQIPAEIVAKWKDQHARGKTIGSDDPWFHHGVGMAVRNACRKQYLDQELPIITQDSGGKPYGPSQNWDDYYFGALAAIASR